MKDLVCPNCKSTKDCILDTHSEGFAHELFECNYCNCLWIIELKLVETIIRPGR